MGPDSETVLAFPIHLMISKGKHHPLANQQPPWPVLGVTLLHQRMDQPSGLRPKRVAETTWTMALGNLIKK